MYTRGEWKFNHLNDLGVEGSPYPIAHIFQNFSPDEVAANAHLISIAPLLFEACKFAEYMLRENTWNHKQERDKAQELLSKALAEGK